ncbi:hypothetical protein EYF80_046887 [Liparis tanakae]|uniref:Uncharacterized protein n=1 Tax=Liparis tanakae TaxID=230148 RepID=A0A4Z2FQC4_9TELE|nr:hypothetical protein EYF80_046887 [Liparis tanakae]
MGCPLLRNAFAGLMLVLLSRDITPRLILATFITITTNTVIINTDNQPESLLPISSPLSTVFINAAADSAVIAATRRVLNHYYVLPWSKRGNPFSLLSFIIFHFHCAPSSIHPSTPPPSTHASSTHPVDSFCRLSTRRCTSLKRSLLLL